MERFGFRLKDDAEEGVGLGGIAVAENGVLQIHLAGHGNYAQDPADLAPVVAVVMQEKKPRVLIFGNAKSEEPTHSVWLDEAKVLSNEKVDEALREVSNLMDDSGAWKSGEGILVLDKLKGILSKHGVD